jgi:hypothetical protein
LHDPRRHPPLRPRTSVGRADDDFADGVPQGRVPTGKIPHHLGDDTVGMTLWRMTD